MLYLLQKGGIVLAITKKRFEEIVKEYLKQKQLKEQQLKKDLHHEQE